MCARLGMGWGGDSSGAGWRVVDAGRDVWVCTVWGSKEGTEGKLVSVYEA